MNVLHIVIGLVVLVVVATVGYFGYMGGFKRVDVENGVFGPAEIVYATHVGPYRTLGQSWRTFQLDVEAAGLTTCDGLSIYLDPPGTPPEQLRTVIGCRIGDVTNAQKQALKEKLPSFVFPETPSLLASFPFKNDLSFMLAPRKVYPKFEKRIIEEGVEPPFAVEMYGQIRSAGAIRFAMPYGLEKTVYQPLFGAFEETVPQAVYGLRANVAKGREK